MPHHRDDRHGHLRARPPAGRPLGPGWTLVLRRQPVRIVDGQPEGGYTDLYELICCYCGDDPDLDYEHVSPELRRIRGPYPIAAGIGAYGRHAEHHHQRPAARRGGSPVLR